MIDCSNITNFISEWERRRKWYMSDKYTETDEYVIGYCHFYESQALEDFKNNITELDFTNLQKEIDSLQEWSNNHPKETRVDKVERFLREQKIFTDNLVCGSHYEKRLTIACTHFDRCEDCSKYWNEEVKKKKKKGKGIKL